MSTFFAASLEEDLGILLIFGAVFVLTFALGETLFRRLVLGVVFGLAVFGFTDFTFALEVTFGDNFLGAFLLTTADDLDLVDAFVGALILLDATLEGEVLFLVLDNFGREELETLILETEAVFF